MGMKRGDTDINKAAAASNSIGGPAIFSSASESASSSEFSSVISSPSSSPSLPRKSGGPGRVLTIGNFNKFEVGAKLTNCDVGSFNTFEVQYDLFKQNFQGASRNTKRN